MDKIKEELVDQTLLEVLLNKEVEVRNISLVLNFPIHKDLKFDKKRNFGFFKKFVKNSMLETRNEEIFRIYSKIYLVFDLLDELKADYTILKVINSKEDVNTLKMTINFKYLVDYNVFINNLTSYLEVNKDKYYDNRYLLLR